MGNSQISHKIIYSEFIGENNGEKEPLNIKQSQGETVVYRPPTHKNKLLDRPDDLSNLQQFFIHKRNFFGNKNYLGYRVDNQYQWMTYKEVIDKAQALGSIIMKMNFCVEKNEYKNYSLKFLSVHSKNRFEYLILDIACCLYGIASVPIYDTLGPNTLLYILSQTNLETYVCSAETLAKFIASKNFANVKTIICFDKLKEDQIQQIKQEGLDYHYFFDLIEKGQSQELVPLPEIQYNDVYTFSYTSGTTGDSKGAMISHGNVLSVCAGVEEMLKLNQNDIHISYLPLAHIFERICYLGVTHMGAQIGFYSGDVLKLRDDLAILKPTIFASVPRLLNRFYDGIKSKLQAVKGIGKCLVTKGLQVKTKNLKATGSINHGFYDKIVFKKTKELLGGRCRLILTGSAPISEEVIDFLKITLCCNLIEGYGQTESTGASFLTNFYDNKAGHVGGPYSNTEYKLEDVPEMNYKSTDVDENGYPRPRGEMCIRGPGVFLGYYKNEEKTNEAIDKDGWLHSGDVCQINKDGSIKIIDRKKNIFKLSQGEYIAAEKIENIYRQCKQVEEVFIYGDSLQFYLIAFIVPNQQEILDFAKSKGLGDNFETLIKHKEVNKFVLDALVTQGKKEKLFGFEQAKKIELLPKSFQDYDLLTTTFKLKRHDAKKFFQAQIDELYKQPISE